MRGRIILLILLVIIPGTAALILLRSAREARRAPTPLGWHAAVSTLAGDGAPGTRDDAQSSRASFADPFGLAVGADGTLYVSDGGESNRIRRLAPDGALTTLAGGAEGFADGAGTAASFNTPSGLAIDAEGNLYIADTGNNRVRRVTPEGQVSTVAGEGTAGHADGPAASARFDAPVGVAVDRRGNVYVADTYNDRVRKITPAGQVTTVAGAGRPGYADGPANDALFDTPCALVVNEDGTLIVADTGNNRLRKITTDGQVTTLPINFPADASTELSDPAGLALTHDGFLYVTEMDRSRVTQVAPDGAARVIAGGGPGYADGDGLRGARFNQPAGLALAPGGALYVADGANYLVRKLSPLNSNEDDSNADDRLAADLVAVVNRHAVGEPLPRLTPATLGEQALLWPLDPQRSPHEVAATLGEVRGSYDTDDSRHHLHSGLDVFGAYGDTVRAVRSEKVAAPLANWGFGSLNEGMRVGIISYIHMHVGRDKDANPFDDPRFVAVRGDDGKPARVRVRRGTRFRTGDAVGTVNRMYHVHMNVGPPGAQVNPLAFAPVGFTDRVAPRIEREGVQLFDESGARLDAKRGGRLVVRGRVRIVVEAHDRADMNPERRRLGLYRLGYQILTPDLAPAPGFEHPRLNIEFDRLPPDAEATKIAYAAESGITVYGSQTTRFLYEVTNTVRDGRAAHGLFDASALPPGDYVLRVIAADYNGNEATEGRDVLITVEGG
ncbi:MAG TPA: NHL repeat-containing protein [Pyrinomonadaceae bacterium]